jgi:hypothetical protein
LSHQIPVVWAAVDCTSLTGFIPNDHSGAIKYLPRSGEEIWSATSHNWWFQGQLAHALDAFPGFDALRYLLEFAVVVRPEEAAEKVAALKGLLKTIETDPAKFCEAIRFPLNDEQIEDTRAGVAQAAVSRRFDDDSVRAHSNFFTFLRSQAAALEEAAAANKCLLYLQSRPNPTDRPVHKARSTESRSTIT